MATPEQVIVGHQRAVAAVRAHVLAYARLVWTAQGSYRDSDVDRIVSLLVPRVQAGQLQVAQLTSAFIASVDTLRSGVTVAPVPVDRDEVLNGRGIDPAEVYRRPAVEVYSALAAGASFSDASARGLVRLNSLAATDLQMSKVRQARTSYQASGRRYFRRVLNGGSNCGLCTIASTQRYRTEHLSPIHPGCDCGVDALADHESREHVIDQTLLDSTHAAVVDFRGGSDLGARDLGLGKTTARGRDLSDFTNLVIVRDHGEYGPTLSWRQDKFTSAADLT